MTEYGEATIIATQSHQSVNSVVGTIEALNANLNPRLLPIGGKLIEPVYGNTAAVTATPAASPENAATETVHLQANQTIYLYALPTAKQEGISLTAAEAQIEQASDINPANVDRLPEQQPVVVLDSVASEVASQESAATTAPAVSTPTPATEAAPAESPYYLVAEHGTTYSGIITDVEKEASQTLAQATAEVVQNQSPTDIGLNSKIPVNNITPAEGAAIQADLDAAANASQPAVTMTPEAIPSPVAAPAAAPAAANTPRIVSAPVVAPTPSLQGVMESAAQIQENEDVLMSTLQADGTTLQGAAGVAGDVQNESDFQAQRLQNTPNGLVTTFQSLTPEQLNNPVLAFGEVQDDPPSKLEAMVQQGLDPNNEVDQINFMVSQIKGTPLWNILTSPNISASSDAIAFMDDFERPANEDITGPARAADANKIFWQYDNQTPPAPAPAPAVPTTPLRAPLQSKATTSTTTALPTSSTTITAAPSAPAMTTPESIPRQYANYPQSPGPGITGSLTPEKQAPSR
jgi:hypothetical protein